MYQMKVPRPAPKMARFFLMSILFLYQPSYGQDLGPDPVELDEVEPSKTPSKPIGGHWFTASEAQEACQFVCARAFPKCDLIGCVPKRETPTIEGCRITCCGDTSHKFCWNCIEIKPGEKTPPPPKSCMPSKNVQEPPPPPPPPKSHPEDPMIIHNMANAHYNEGASPKPPKQLSPSSPQEKNSGENDPTASLPSILGNEVAKLARTKNEAPKYDNDEKGSPSSLSSPPPQSSLPSSSPSSSSPASSSSSPASSSSSPPSSSSSPPSSSSSNQSPKKESLLPVDSSKASSPQSNTGNNQVINNDFGGDSNDAASNLVGVGNSNLDYLNTNSLLKAQ
jgi:hypothetical protein